jgi:hypothetical protein
MTDSVVPLACTVQPSPVGSGARVRDRSCGGIHTLTRPRGAASDVLLVYECAVRASPLSPSVPLVHTGAILGRLVHGLELVGTD